jgi:hypothetical protein
VSDRGTRDDRGNFLVASSSRESKVDDASMIELLMIFSSTSPPSFSFCEPEVAIKLDSVQMNETSPAKFSAKFEFRFIQEPLMIRLPRIRISSSLVTHWSTFNESRKIDCRNRSASAATD